jgi:hypothetical protein
MNPTRSALRAQCLASPGHAGTGPGLSGLSAALARSAGHAQGAQELLREVAEPTCCNAVATITC